MRTSASLLIVGCLALAAIAQAQPPAASTRAKPPLAKAQAPQPRPTASRPAPAAKGQGFLSLGATDITGNKELPKVMAIVPWKSATGAGGVVAPTDSLLSEALQPVDRGVLQRQIRYYGQLAAGASRRAPARVAPVGDSR
jgi:hypothetical protein